MGRAAASALSQRGSVRLERDFTELQIDRGMEREHAGAGTDREHQPGAARESRAPWPIGRPQSSRRAPDN